MIQRTRKLVERPVWSSTPFAWVKNRQRRSMDIMQNEFGAAGLFFSLSSFHYSVASG